MDMEEGPACECGGGECIPGWEEAFPEVRREERMGSREPHSIWLCKYAGPSASLGKSGENCVGERDAIVLFRENCAHEEIRGNPFEGGNELFLSQPTVLQTLFKWLKATGGGCWRGPGGSCGKKSPPPPPRFFLQSLKRCPRCPAAEALRVTARPWK